MNITKWLAIGAVSISLCGCVSSTGVSVTSQSSASYPPVPAGQVTVSSHPPKGMYVVIASLSTDAQTGETPSHILQRLQQQAAALGADYLLVTSVSDKVFPTPNDVEYENPYLRAEYNMYATAPVGSWNSTTLQNPSGAYMREVITAKALKITSGSNKPNKKAPSVLPQLQK